VIIDLDQYSNSVPKLNEPAKNRGKTLTEKVKINIYRYFFRKLCIEACALLNVFRDISRKTGHTISFPDRLIFNFFILDLSVLGFITSFSEALPSPLIRQCDS
jgi:hypothetical protein